MFDYYVVVDKAEAQYGQGGFCEIVDNSVVINGAVFDLSQVEVGCPCFWCGAIHLYADLIYSLGEEEWVCKSCHEKLFYTCDSCGKDWHKNHVVCAGGKYYCLDCTWMAD